MVRARMRVGANGATQPDEGSTPHAGAPPPPPPPPLDVDKVPISQAYAQDVATATEDDRAALEEHERVRAAATLAQTDDGAVAVEHERVRAAAATTARTDDRAAVEHERVRAVAARTDDRGVVEDDGSAADVRPRAAAPARPERRRPAATPVQPAPAPSAVTLPEPEPASVAGDAPWTVPWPWAPQGLDLASAVAQWQAILRASGAGAADDARARRPGVFLPPDLPF